MKKVEYVVRGTISAERSPRGQGQMSIETTFPHDAIDDFADTRSDAPERAARFLKSLAHRDRLRVLCGLVDGELPVAEIEARVGASQSAVSQHLARLRDEGVVTARRDGRRILYAIADPTVLQLITVLYARFCGADGDLARQSAATRAGG